MSKTALKNVARERHFQRGPGPGLRAGFLTGDQVRAVFDGYGSEDYRWLLVCSGGGWATDEHGVRARLRPGSLFVRAPHVRHRVERDVDGAWCEFFLGLPPSMSHGLAALGVISPGMRHCQVAMSDEVIAILSGWVERLAAARTAAETCEHIARLFRIIDQRRSDGGGDDARRLADAYRCLADPSAGVAAVARDLQLSQECFRRWFQARTGISPKRWQIEQRIERAKDLLADTTLSIAAVAEHLGYADGFTFSKQFKQITGQPPSAYR